MDVDAFGYCRSWDTLRLTYSAMQLCPLSGFDTRSDRVTDCLVLMP